METPTKKPRVDKRKNVGKVAEALAKNPNKTVREIAKETGLGTSTSNRAIQELVQSGTKDETISYIVGAAKDRIKRVSGIFDRFITESEQKKELSRADIKEIKDIVKDDMARVTVLGGTITDDKGGLKDITRTNDTSLRELEALREKLMN